MFQIIHLDNISQILKKNSMQWPQGMKVQDYADMKILIS